MRAAKGNVPEGEYTIPLGEAKVVREGRQVTVLAWGAMVHTAIEAAEQGAAQGYDLEVIDLGDDTVFVGAVDRPTDGDQVLHRLARSSGFSRFATAAQ